MMIIGDLSLMTILRLGASLPSFDWPKMRDCATKNPPEEFFPPKGINIRALLSSVVWDSVPEDE
jgi:hypothetical protein